MSYPTIICLGVSDEDHHFMAGPVCFGVSQDSSTTADCRSFLFDFAKQAQMN